MMEQNPGKRGRISFEFYLSEFEEICSLLGRLNLIDIPAGIKYKISAYQDYVKIRIPHKAEEPIENVDAPYETIRRSPWTGNVKVEYA